MYLCRWIKVQSLVPENYIIICAVCNTRWGEKQLNTVREGDKLFSVEGSSRLATNEKYAMRVFYKFVFNGVCSAMGIFTRKEPPDRAAVSCSRSSTLKSPLNSSKIVSLKFCFLHKKNRETGWLKCMFIVTCIAPSEVSLLEFWS